MAGFQRKAPPGGFDDTPDGASNLPFEVLGQVGADETGDIEARPRSAGPRAATPSNAMEVLGDLLVSVPPPPSRTHDRDETVDDSPGRPPMLAADLLREVKPSLPPGVIIPKRLAPAEEEEDRFTEIADIEVVPKLDKKGKGGSPPKRTNDPLFEQLLPGSADQTRDDGNWIGRARADLVVEQTHPGGKQAAVELKEEKTEVSPPPQEPEDVNLGPKYKVTSVLGEGAMGKVFAAEHVLLKQRVAVKLVHDPDPKLIERLRREAEALARIRHPGIVAIHDYDVTPDGRPFVVMERLDGEDLATRLQLRGKLSTEEAIELGVEIADALAAAHAQNVVHRDLKPGNIFLVRESGGREVIKLIDFGAANIRDTKPLTVFGALIGTPAYMAPEQISGQGVGPQTDVYALGLVLFEAITGQQPFSGDRFEQSLAKVLSMVPGLASECGADSAVLDQILKQALAKDPGDRPKSMKDFMDLLSAKRQGTKAEPRDGLVQELIREDVIEPGSSEPMTLEPMVHSTPPKRAMDARTIWVGASLLLILLAAMLVIVFAKR